MATLKISQLTPIAPLNSNTANVVFVATDTQSGVSGKISAHTLATGLYANNILNVGNNAVTLPNTVAQFAAAGDSYVQTNLVNTNDGGSADIVVTANTGTDSTYFIDVGYANKDYEAGSENVLERIIKVGTKKNEEDIKRSKSLIKWGAQEYFKGVCPLQTGELNDPRICDNIEVLVYIYHASNCQNIIKNVRV